ncbi:MAG: hypothetical protein A2X48_23095 [Lentisphaerae bacterium GWF2_49_21]|nr:MAG: hypothetical protein A2X48_23095 [Lentisphaerae bacterium GWF2_49_21]
MKKILVLAISGLLISSLSTFAQDGGGQAKQHGGGGAPGTEVKRPMPPLISALDANSDMTIDDKEIAGAPAALKKLDKDKDGKLSYEEYRFQRPGATEGAEVKRPSRMSSTLDTNGDMTIDEKEIAASAASLKKLDTNGDGKLAMDELRPQRPAAGAEGEKKPEAEKKAEPVNDFELKPPTGGK